MILTQRTGLVRAAAPFATLALLGGCTIIPSAPDTTYRAPPPPPPAVPSTAPSVAAYPARDEPRPSYLVPAPAGPSPDAAPVTDPPHPQSPPYGYEAPPALTLAALGQSVSVDGPKVTPLEILEDSRCPADTQCVWPGQVRLRIRVTLGSRTESYEITSGRPILVADGTLNLAETRPGRVAGVAGQTVRPSDYRFGFRFMGGY